MEAQFWHERWEQDEIAFHEPAANPLLVRYFKELSLPAGSRVFLPLCGKTLDIPWLLAQGHSVVGVELSTIAIDALFAGMGENPEVSRAGQLTRYSLPGVDVFAGDFFALTSSELGPVDAIYDRAALVALPEEMRVAYAKHLVEITRRAPQLLITFEYNQALLQGPPFSIPDEEVSRHYQAAYEVRPLASVEVEGGLKKKTPAVEKVWLLTPQGFPSR